MIELIHDHRMKIEELCRRFKVRTLEIFGSASDGTFDAARSDLDFLVEFLPLEVNEHADMYFGLLHGLEDLFQRKIDLVMSRAIQNKYFLRSVNESRKTVYAA